MLSFVLGVVSMLAFVLAVAPAVVSNAGLVLGLLTPSLFLLGLVRQTKMGLPLSPGGCVGSVCVIGDCNVDCTGDSLLKLMS